MSNDSPPESYYIPPDFDDAGEEERKPRGQGGMTDREYILRLEDAIENAATESTQPCGFCESEDYTRHIHNCVYAMITGAALMPSNQTSVATFGWVDTEKLAKSDFDPSKFHALLKTELDAEEAAMLSVLTGPIKNHDSKAVVDLYNSEILLRKMSGG